MSRLRCKLITFAGLIIAAVSQSAHAQPTVADQCITDLSTLAPYLLANDAGASDHVEQKGQAAFDAAFATARGLAAAAVSDDSCLSALRSYLLTFRRTHLSLRPTNSRGVAAGVKTPAPAFRMLSASTALLTVPSFADQTGNALARMLDEHARDLAKLPNLIIDVRGNTGGSDWTYQPLLLLVSANRRRDVSALLLATPANSAANRALCDLVAPDSKQCRDATHAASEAMDRALPGTFIPIPGEQAVEIVEPGKVAPYPRRVGILVDKRCGSTCEEFLLAARQSFKVKLFGQASAGALDYSNLRPFLLPSGKRLLMYATSRSLRLPHFAVDAAGIPPDQLLPMPIEQEVVEVQRVLESGQ